MSVHERRENEELFELVMDDGTIDSGERLVMEKFFVALRSINTFVELEAVPIAVMQTDDLLIMGADHKYKEDYVYYIR